MHRVVDISCGGLQVDCDTLSARTFASICEGRVPIRIHVADSAGSMVRPIVCLKANVSVGAAGGGASVPCNIVENGARAWTTVALTANGPRFVEAVRYRCVEHGCLICCSDYYLKCFPPGSTVSPGLLRMGKVCVHLNHHGLTVLCVTRFVWSVCEFREAWRARLDSLLVCCPNGSTLGLC